MKRFESVDQYMLALPAEARRTLENLRKAARQAAPCAEETISYNMPALRWNGILVWFAAHKQHVGLYPRAAAIAAFKDELKNYKTSRGAIQFPMAKAIPAGLVKRIVRFRVKENEKSASKPRRREY